MAEDSLGQGGIPDTAAVGSMVLLGLEGVG